MDTSSVDVCQIQFLKSYSVFCSIIKNVKSLENGENVISLVLLYLVNSHEMGSLGGSQGSMWSK